MQTPAPIYYIPTDNGPIWPITIPAGWYGKTRPIPYRLTEAVR